MKSKIKKFLKDYMQWIPSKPVIILILFFSLVVFSNKEFEVNNDFWFLINTGKYIINNGFPVIEPFTIHQGFEFIAQQWLTDIIFYVIYNKFNIYGMFVFINVVNIIIVYLLYKISLLISDNKVKLSLLVTIITYVILNVSFITTRPQLFDIVLLLLELYFLELYIKHDNKKYLIVLPIISILMINLHSSLWLMVIVFLIPYIVGRLNFPSFVKNNYKLKPLFFTIIIMFLIGFINPYGISSFEYLFNSYGINHINEVVSEMKPLTINSLSIYVYIFIILLSYYFNRKNKINLRYLLFFLGTLYLGMLHYRGLLFLMLAAVLSLNYNFKDYFNEQKITVSNKKINILCIVVAVGLVIIYAFIFDIINEKEYRLYNIANFLDDSTNKNIKLYTNYNDGGYLEYRGYKCYIDPRAEVFLKENNKKEDIMLEYYKLQSGFINYREFLDKYDFDYLLVDSYDVLYYNMDNTKYQVVYEKENGTDENGLPQGYRIYKKQENYNEKNT